MKRIGMVLVLLAAVAAGGAWNYQRNLAKEQQKKGPFATYSDTQLAALADGYTKEIQKLKGRYETEKANPHQGGNGQMLDEQVQDFEKAASRGRAIRAAGGDLSETEAALKDIQAEQTLRRQDPKDVLLRRLLTF